MKLLFLRVAPVATTGSHCGGRVPRHKGASRRVSRLERTGAKWRGNPPSGSAVPHGGRTASPQRTGFSVPLW
ncbi:MAG: hypothetical protein ACYT04_19105 [Nostoc sp.]